MNVLSTGPAPSGLVVPPPREFELSHGLEVPLDVARFDRVALAQAPAGSYQWWYFDALSDDGRYGIVCIYFIGGSFSSLYADRWMAGAKPSPYDHPMVNVAIYDRNKRVGWVFSEYPREHLKVNDPCLDLEIGTSTLRRPKAGTYELEVRDDDFFPWRTPVHAKVRFVADEAPLAPPGGRLSTDGRHVWGSPAPRGRVQVEVPTLGLKWEGAGYHDMNAGAEPLYEGFRHWGWGRAHLGDETRIYYDALEKDGTRVRHLLRGRDGKLDYLEANPESAARRTLTPWLVSMPTYEAGAKGERISVEREAMLESSPFYVRFVGRFNGANSTSRGICEYVDLARFASPSVRFMIRHRTYRRTGPGGPALPVQVSASKVFR